RRVAAVSSGVWAGGCAAVACRGCDFAQAANGVHALLHDTVRWISDLGQFAGRVIAIRRGVGGSANDLLQLGHLAEIVVGIVFRADAVGHGDEAAIVEL